MLGNESNAVARDGYSSLSLEDFVGLHLEVGGDLANVRVGLGRLLVDLLELELLLLANLKQVHLD